MHQAGFQSEGFLLCLKLKRRGLGAGMLWVMENEYSPESVGAVVEHGVVG